MTYFKSGDMVILVRGTQDTRDYLYEVVDHVPKDVVIINRPPYGTESYGRELTVSAADLILADEPGWELLPVVRDSYAGVQYFMNEVWRDAYSGFSNRGNYYPLRRKLNVTKAD